MKFEELTAEFQQQAIEMELNLANQIAEEYLKNGEFYTQEDDEIQELLHLTDYEIVKDNITGKEILQRSDEQ